MSFDIFQNIMTASDPAGGRAIKVTLQTGIDDAESYYTKSDSAGGRAIKVSLVDSGALILAGNVPLSTTPTNVADGAGNTSPLQLSTNQVRIGRESNDTPLALFGTKGSLAIFNTFSVGSGDKTFSFPNASMTFAGINIAQTFTATQTISNINLGTSAAVGGTLNLGDNLNNSRIQAGGYSVYTHSTRHLFDSDARGVAFGGNMYIGANTATSNTRLQVLGINGQNIVRFDDHTSTSKFILTNTGVATYNATAGTPGIIFDVQIGGVSRLRVTGSNGIIEGATIGTTNSTITNFKDSGFNVDWAVITPTTGKVTYSTLWRHTALPTTRPTTVGDIYVDTAANVLSNGDRVLAIRV